MKYYNKNLREIYSELESSEHGMSESKAEEKLKVFGENVLEKQKKVSFFRKVLDEFKNIMIIILIISAVISIATAITTKDRENLFEGLLILAIVVVNAVVGVIQEQKAENALLALQKSIEPFSKVYRSGSLKKIKNSDLVPGDVIELKVGDIVPADLRLITCNNLRLNESSLTGESQAVQKNADVLTKTNLTLADQENICFSGTSVTSGSGKGIIFATGKNTEIGKIAKAISQTKKEKTPLEKNIDKIGKVLTIGVLAIVVVVFLVQIFFNKSQSVLDSLLTAVALAVAAIPESLPAVITIIMALGVQRLAKKNAIIKKLSAVETLGSCNVICSDKTGTLTKNEMSVSHVCTGFEVLSGESVTEKQIEVLCKIGAVCNSAKISDQKIVADATETAIIKYLQKIGVNVDFTAKNIKKLQESEFNSIKKTMSVKVAEMGKEYIFQKGAIDYLLPDCTKISADGKVRQLSENEKKKILKLNDDVCKLGERVIAFSYRDCSREKEDEFIFAGFLGIIDPPREEAKASIKQCKKAGLKVIMITGDHPSTALAIARDLGIASNKKEVLTGAELNKLSGKELEKVIHNYSVFARVTPEHKLMIVNALKASGNIVAMTGDGINDAPGIKQANIGACMGSGTDVTKEVADIIIGDDNFSTIVCAVEEGRTIYKNITKTILFLLSTNIVEVLGIFVTSLMVPGTVFLTATQILFINLVTDSLPAFALGIEPPEKNIMEIPPRDPQKQILSGSIGTSIIYQGFIQSLLVLVMFVTAKWEFGGPAASTMVFLTICLMQIIHAINCKTEKSLFKINVFKNSFFNISFLILLALILGVYFVPLGAKLFNLTTLNSLQWLIVGGISLSIIPLVEIGKIFIKEK